MVTLALGKEIGSDVENLTFQEGDLFSAQSFQFGQISWEKSEATPAPGKLSLNATSSRRQPSIRNLGVFIFLQLLRELVTSAEGLPQMCYCFTLAAPSEMCRQNLVPRSFTEVGCYRTRIAASNCQDKTKMSCFLMEEYEEHMFGQAGGQYCAFTSQGWLGSGMPIKTSPTSSPSCRGKRKP